MQTVWYIRGDKSGTFGRMTDKEAKEQAAAGVVHIVGGGGPLPYHERHPAVIKGSAKLPEPKRTASKKKYPNKQMKTEG